MFSPKHPRLHCWKSQILETKVWTRSPIDLHASIHSIPYNSEGPPGGLSVVTWFTNVTPTITNIKLQTHGSNACKLILRSGQKKPRNRFNAKPPPSSTCSKRVPSCQSGCVHAEARQYLCHWQYACTGLYGKCMKYIWNIFQKSTRVSWCSMYFINRFHRKQNPHLTKVQQAATLFRHRWRRSCSHCGCSCGWRNTLHLGTRDMMRYAHYLSPGVVYCLTV